MHISQGGIHKDWKLILSQQLAFIFYNNELYGFYLDEY